jgi:thymidine phosphorylase
VNQLRLRRLGIDTYQEPVLYMHRDCHVCQSEDVVAGRYNDVHLASFVTACSAFPLDLDETMGLTRAMVDVGDRLSWGAGIVVDKHSVGGLPGNRTTRSWSPLSPRRAC